LTFLVTFCVKTKSNKQREIKFELKIHIEAI
jgi:hypothetical protein